MASFLFDKWFCQCFKIAVIHFADRLIGIWFWAPSRWPHWRIDSYSYKFCCIWCIKVCKIMKVLDRKFQILNKNIKFTCVEILDLKFGTKIWKTEVCSIWLKMYTSFLDTLYINFDDLVWVALLFHVHSEETSRFRVGGSRNIEKIHVFWWFGVGGPTFSFSY